MQYTEEIRGKKNNPFAAIETSHAAAQSSELLSLDSLRNRNMDFSRVHKLLYHRGKNVGYKERFERFPGQNNVLVETECVKLGLAACLKLPKREGKCGKTKRNVNFAGF